MLLSGYFFLLILVESYTFTLFSLQGETDDEAELQFKNLLSSSEDDDITTDKSNTTQSNNLSVLSNTSISLIIIFVMTWKVMHNLSDAAVNILFCFLKRLLDLMARMIHCKALKQISNLLPQSLYMIRKYLGINRDDIEKLIVCPKCSSCYKSEDCVQTLSNE